VEPSRASIGTPVTFTLERAVDMAACGGQLRLFIDGRLVSAKGPVAVADGGTRVTFDLAYDDSTPELKTTWQQVVGLNRSAALAAGLAGQGPFAVADPLSIQARAELEKKEPKTPIERARLSGTSFAFDVSTARAVAFIVLGLALLLGFIRLATTSNILRNSELTSSTPGSTLYCFSLAKCQMAWWLFLTTFAVVFIWLVVGRFTMTGQVLVLLGISAATALGAVVIDAGRQAGTADAVNKATAEAATTTAAAAALAAAAPTVPGAPAAPLAALAAAQQSKITALAKDAWPPKSKGSFFKDILSDENGVSLHRFQIMAWTLVLGLYFVFEVLSKFEMPTLSTELLTLVGISNSTYLGFKFPERRG
jgi:hypothetical protein